MQYHVINSQLICAQYDKEYPMIESGKGVFLYDKSGKEYIDASGCTAAVTAIGHGVQEVVDVLAKQAQTLAVHPTHVFYHETLESYLKDICELAPDGFDKAWTICGGTEAVENSVKLAFQYHVAKGRTTRNKVIGRWGSYHGNSLTALDIGGMKVRRSFYTPLMTDHLHVSPCFPYRKSEELTLEAYEDSLIDEFRETVEAHPDQIIAFIAEPIVGAALGAASPTPTYFSRIAEICQAHDILMIADEVMTGFGRTGTAFGIEHFGNHADILACAKGISSGYFPMGAVIAHHRVTDAIQASGHPFYSGQTYSCIPLAAAVGQAVLDYIKQHDIIDNANTTGAYLKGLFQSMMDELPCIGDVRGEGLFLGIEFVRDRKTKAIFPPETVFAKSVETAALQHGLIGYACRGTVEGTKGDHMLFAPPLTLTTQEADMLAERLKAAIKDVWEKQ